MRVFQTLAISITTVFMMIAAQGTTLLAQSTSAVSTSPSTAVTISIEKDHIPSGQSPIVVLAIKNITNHIVQVRSDQHLYRIHVEDTTGEAPKTEFHRHLLGEFRPGDGPVLPGGMEVSRDVMPGDSGVRRFELARFYDLNALGKYTAYLEVHDESGAWLRTNIVHFEIEAPSQ